MKIVINIRTENAAFQENPHELSRILHKLADKLQDPNASDSCLMDGSVMLKDINGNTVGNAEFLTEEE